MLKNFQHYTDILPPKDFLWKPIKYDKYVICGNKFCIGGEIVKLLNPEKDITIITKNILHNCTTDDKLLLILSLHYDDNALVESIGTSLTSNFKHDVCLICPIQSHDHKLYKLAITNNWEIYPYHIENKDKIPLTYMLTNLRCISGIVDTSIFWDLGPNFKNIDFDKCKLKAEEISKSMNNKLVLYICPKNKSVIVTMIFNQIGQFLINKYSTVIPKNDNDICKIIITDECNNIFNILETLVVYWLIDNNL